MSLSVSSSVMENNRNGLIFVCGLFFQVKVCCEVLKSLYLRTWVGQEEGCLNLIDKKLVKVLFIFFRSCNGYE